MSQFANIIVAFTALVHIGLMIIEVFFWKQPFVHERLEFTLQEAVKATPIVANAGLYNGFIGAGLIWSLASGSKGYSVKIFFLICVIIAGIFGAVTLKPTTLIIQTLPALAALLLVWISRPLSNQLPD
jgi:putative membrane protein